MNAAWWTPGRNCSLRAKQSDVRLLPFLRHSDEIGIKAFPTATTNPTNTIHSDTLHITHPFQDLTPKQPIPHSLTDYRRGRGKSHTEKCGGAKASQPSPCISEMRSSNERDIHGHLKMHNLRCPRRRESPTKSASVSYSVHSFRSLVSLTYASSHPALLNNP